MRPLTKAICFGLITEAVVMLLAVLTGSYATPVFTSPLSESGFDIPGKLLHFPGYQLFRLLFNFLHRFDDWHLSPWWQLFWIFTFQATFWSALTLIFILLKSRRQNHENHAP